MSQRSGPARPVAVSVFSFVLAAIGALAAGLVVARGGADDATLTWPLVAAGFAATELTVVHLRVGRNVFSLTLHEAVLVAAALTATPRDAVLGLVVGTVVVIGGIQRLGIVKLLFNVGQYLVGAAAVIGLLHPLGRDAVDSPVMWVRAFAVTVVVGLGTMVLVATAIRLAEGTSIATTVRQSIASSVCVTVIATSTGLTVAAIAVPSAVHLLVLVPLLVVVAFGVRSQRELHVRVDQLELVHDTVRSLSDATELEPALELLATRARTTLSADRVLILLCEGAGERRHLTVDAAGCLWGDVDQGVVEALLAATQAGGGAAHVESSSNMFAGLFGSLGKSLPSTALLADLAVGPHVLGVLAVLRGRGAASTSPAELELLRSLAIHAAVTLEARHLAEANRTLRQRAVDPVLGLPLTSAIDDRLAEASGPQALVLVTLVSFEYVTDLYGFDLGDHVLVAVARRLRNLVRPEDLVARVGRDEFGVLISGATDPFAVEAFGERVAQQMAVPFRIEGAPEPLRLGTRVGVGFGDAGHCDAAALARNARERVRRRNLRQHLGVDGF